MDVDPVIDDCEAGARPEGHKKKEVPFRLVTEEEREKVNEILESLPICWTHDEYDLYRELDRIDIGGPPTPHQIDLICRVAGHKFQDASPEWLARHCYIFGTNAKTIRDVLRQLEPHRERLLAMRAVVHGADHSGRVEMGDDSGIGDDGGSDRFSGSMDAEGEGVSCQNIE